VHDADATDDFRGQLHSRFSRFLAGALVLVSRASLVAIALAGALGASDLFLPFELAPTLLGFSVLPAVAAWLVERAAAARAAVLDDALLLSSPDVRIEVPRGALERVVPWTLPLPGPGVSFALASGRRLPHGFETDDPAALLAALRTPAAARHPIVVWAHARAASPPWRWPHLLWKFAGFALAPTAVLWNAHQHIAYGGTLGQYYLEGLGPYVRTFAVYWLTTSVYLILWASVWRALGEGVALAAAVVAPSHAARVRRAVEFACRLLFYAGVPALVAVRFLV
jgi:hypothetical protein